MDTYCIKIKKGIRILSLFVFLSWKVYEMLTVAKMSWVVFTYFNDQPVYHCKIFIKKIWEYWRKIWSTILGQQMDQLNRQTNWVENKSYLLNLARIIKVSIIVWTHHRLYVTEHRNNIGHVNYWVIINREMDTIFFYFCIKFETKISNALLQYVLP